MDTTRPSARQSNHRMARDSTQKTEDRAAAGLLALEVMHDLRNPLEALSHLTYLAHEEAGDPEKVRRYMALAEEQVKTLTDLASQTLGFTRPSQVHKPGDLVRVAEAALRIHQRTIEARNIHLVRSLPKDLVTEIHSGEMLQVISNLIVNALDALPDEGTLSLRFRRHSGKIHLVIADNGHGIPEEHRRSIFEPFFTTKEERGNGLGLALSKRIVDRHKGSIHIRSCVVPGKSGTTFRICLPA